MVQRNEANLEFFEEVFPLFKVEVDTKRISVPSDNEDEESPAENPTTLSISGPHPSAMLELDLAEFKELTQTTLCSAKREAPSAQERQPGLGI